MSAKKMWTAERLDELERLVKDPEVLASKGPRNTIARKMDLQYYQVAHGLKELRAIRPDIDYSFNRSPAVRYHDAKSRGWIPEAGTTVWEPLVISAKRILVTSDWHVGYYDAEMMNRAIRVAKLLGIKEMVLVGDALDLMNLSVFEPRTRSEKQTGVEDELDELGYMMSRWLGHFDRIYYIMGNHEARGFKAMQWEIGVDKFFSLLNLPDAKRERLTVDSFEYCVIKSAGTQWICSHDKARRVPLSRPRDHTVINESNVLSAGGHDLGWTTGLGGRVAGALGGMFDPRRFHYVQRSLGNFGKLQPGFWVIINGQGFVEGHPEMMGIETIAKALQAGAKKKSR